MTRGDIEAELSDVLTSQAASVPVERDPYEATRHGLRRARRRRWLATAVSLCLVAAVAVPVVAFRPFRDVPLEGWGLRGNLADNQTFVEAARTRAIEEIKQQGGLDTGRRVEYSRVVYAGEHGKRHLAVVVLTWTEHELAPAASGGDPAGTEMNNELVLLRGSPGGKPASLEAVATLYLPSDSLDMPAGLLPEKPIVAWVWKVADGEGRLFVLGPPGTGQVAYSAQPTFHPNGTWDRSWRRIPAHNGVAYGTPAQLDAVAGLVRLRAAGETIFTSPILEMASAESPRADPSDAASGIPMQVAVNARGDLHRSTGLAMDRFRLRMLWYGGEWNWLVVATRPDGLTFQLLSAEMVGNRVTLVPEGKGARPVAAASHFWGHGTVQHPPNRVVVIAPGVEDGRAELWRGGDKLVAARLGGDGHAEFRGQEVVEAIEADDAELTFRVFDQDGEEIYRGHVSDAWQPPWNEPDRTR